ncbi:MAG: pyruvate formate lyase-activating protein [Clostridia bacterium]|nr:pyruvate formate lyase-activating protein [Clostridia bacterium]
MTNFESVKGFIHSIQTLGTLDGPGVRFVVFTQGCPLRCGCCHNPDTWAFEGGTEYTAGELAARAERYRAYFGDAGGVTLSGGEPLLQAEFSAAFFSEAHARGMNTCLDTSGCILNEPVKALLQQTDRVLLDLKYPTDALYRMHVGCSINTPLAFLRYLDEQGIPTTLRQVLIPALNDTEENVAFLADVMKRHACIDRLELLPFKKICTVKYEKMGIAFPFSHLPTPTAEDVARVYNAIKKGSQA